MVPKNWDAEEPKAGEISTPKSHEFTSGARSSKVKPRYDLVPQITVELIAERHEFGAEIHGEWNYLKGKTDPKFIRDRKNHLVEHALLYARYGKRSDLAAILCNGSMLAELGAFKEDKDVDNPS